MEMFGNLSPPHHHRTITSLSRVPDLHLKHRDEQSDEFSPVSLPQKHHPSRWHRPAQRSTCITERLGRLIASLVHSMTSDGTVSGNMIHAAPCPTFSTPTSLAFSMHTLKIFVDPHISENSLQSRPGPSLEHPHRTGCKPSTFSPSTSSACRSLNDCALAIFRFSKLLT